jgi:hypothetical protein
MAVCTTSLMSSTGRPKRAARARSMVTATVGWPSVGKTAMSVMPRTWPSSWRMRSALAVSTSSSGPNTLMALAPFTPEAASCTLSLIICA